MPARAASFTPAPIRASPPRRPNAASRHDLAAAAAPRAPPVHYKLRDWLFSRQRYWGEPFPIAWVDEADYRRAQAARPADFPAEPVTFVQDGVARYALPLPAAALPPRAARRRVLPAQRPMGESFPSPAPATGSTSGSDPATGASAPAAGPPPAVGAWVRARRETNTHAAVGRLLLVLPPLHRTRTTISALGVARSPALLARPDDIYVGGAEHAVLHLLYARFWHKVLFDLGVVPENEPFRKLFHQGIILGEDGEKMSKSRGNVVSPDAIIASHGTDTLRLYLMFLGPLEAMKPWNPQGIEGVHRFLQRFWRESLGRDGAPHPKLTDGPGEPPELTRVVHATIKKVGEDIEALRFNTAIAQMMICVNAMQKAPAISRGSLRAFLAAPGAVRAARGRGAVGAGRRRRGRLPHPPDPVAALRSRPPGNPDGEARLSGQRPAPGRRGGARRPPRGRGFGARAGPSQSGAASGRQAGEKSHLCAGAHSQFSG